MISCSVVLTRALREYFGVLLRLLRLPAIGTSLCADYNSRCQTPDRVHQVKSGATRLDRLSSAMPDIVASFSTASHSSTASAAGRRLGDHRTEEAPLGRSAGVERQDRRADVATGPAECELGLGPQMHVVRLVIRSIEIRRIEPGSGQQPAVPRRDRRPELPPAAAGRGAPYPPRCTSVPTADASSDPSRIASAIRGPDDRGSGPPDTAGVYHSWVLSSLSIHSEMNRQSTSYCRCSATLVTHREVIQAHGHTGSKKKSRAAIDQLPGMQMSSGPRENHLDPSSRCSSIPEGT